MSKNVIPENTVLRDMQERLKKAQQKKLSQYAQKASKENLLARREAQVEDLQNIRKENEFYSAMGLGSGIGYDPSSGVDAQARRMAGLDSLNQTLKIIERRRAAAMKAAAEARYYVKTVPKPTPDTTTTTAPMDPTKALRETTAQQKKQPEQKQALKEILGSSGYKIAIGKNAYTDKQMEQKGLGLLPSSVMGATVNETSLGVTRSKKDARTWRLQKETPATSATTPTHQQMYDYIVKNEGADAGRKYLLQVRSDILQGPFKYDSKGELTAMYKRESVDYKGEVAFQNLQKKQYQKSQLLALSEEQFQRKYTAAKEKLHEMKLKKLEMKRQKDAAGNSLWTDENETWYKVQQREVKNLSTVQTERRANVYNAAVADARKASKENRDAELATMVADNGGLVGRLLELQAKRIKAQNITRQDIVNGNVQNLGLTEAEEEEYQQLTERKNMLLSARDLDIADERKAQYAEMMKGIESEAGYSDAVKAARKLTYAEGREKKNGKEQSSDTVYLDSYNKALADLILGKTLSAKQKLEDYYGFKNTYSVEDKLLLDEAYKAMTGQEKDAFLYFASQGNEQAQKYLDSIQTYLNERSTESLVKSMERFSETSPVLAAITARGTALFSGQGFVHGTLMRLFGNEIDPYSPAFAYLVATETIDSSVAQLIRDKIGDEGLGNAAAFGYETMMSVADSTIAIFIGGGSGAAAEIASLALMSTRAAASTMRDVLVSGGTQNQALAMGFLSGTFEALFEKVSLDKLWSAKSTERLITRVLKQAGTEMSEEFCTEISNVVADILVMGNRNDIETSVRRYLSMGYTRAEAEAMAARDAMTQIGMAAAGGLLSGGVMGGGFGVMQDANTRKTGKALGGDAAMEQAKSYMDDPDVMRFMDKLSRAMTKQRGVNMAAGRLNMATADAAIDTKTVKATLKQLIEDGTLTKKQASSYEKALEEYRAAWESGAEISADAQEVLNGIELEILHKLMPGTAKEIAAETVTASFRDTASVIRDITERVNDRQRGKSDQTAPDANHPSGDVKYGAMFPGTEVAPSAASVSNILKQRGAVHVPVDPVMRQRLEGQGYKSVPGTNMMAPPSVTAEAFTQQQADEALSSREPRKSYTNKDGVKVTLYNGDRLDNLSPEQKAYLKFAGVIQRMGGVNVEMHDTLAFAGSDGFYTESTNTMHLCLDATSYGGTVAHELTHFIEKWSPDAWQSLRDFCEAQANKHSAHGWESLMEKRTEQYGEASAESEAVASMMEGILADETAIREFCQKNESLGRKILDRLGDLIDLLKETFAGDKNDAAAKWISDTEKARELWFAALEGANKTAAESDQMIRNATVAKTAEQIRDAVDQFGIDLRPYMPAGTRVGENTRAILDELYDAVKTGDTAAYDGLSARIFDALSRDNSITWQNFGLDEAQAKEIRQKIRDARFSISENRHQASDSVKRKDGHYFGRLTFVKNGGQRLMQFYDDLRVNYPGLFDEVSSSNDAADVLNDYMRGMAKQTTGLSEYMKANPEEGAALEDAITELTTELTGRLYEIADQSGNQYRIRVGMSDDERTELLQNARIRIAHYNQEKSPISENDIQKLQSVSGKEAKKYFRSIAHKFDDLRKSYMNDGMEMEFSFSGGTVNESYAKQFGRGRYSSLAKIIANIDSVFANAIPIEAHADIYKNGVRGDEDMQATYVMLSVLQDGKETIPVEIVAKEFQEKENKIHLAVSIETHEPGAKASGSNSLETHTDGTHGDTISICDLISLVNPEDTSFLKYFPNAILSPQQIVGKKRGKNEHRLRPALQAGKERIAAVSTEDAEAAVLQMRNVKRWSMLDPVRMMDRSARTPQTRQLLYDVLEKPFNEAGGEYGRMLQTKSDELLAKMKELGIGKKESQAIQRYGEGTYQDRYGEPHDYTAVDLRRDFPDTWQNIVKAERVIRDMYDGYIDDLNDMLETVYPEVIEHAESDAAALQKRIDLAQDQAKNQRELIISIKDKIERTKTLLDSKNRADTQAYANLQNSLAYQNHRLSNAEALLSTYEQRITVRITQKAAIEAAIKNGDVLRNRRVEHRRDYFHHFREMEEGVGDLTNILKTNTEIDANLAGKSDQTRPKSRWASFMQRRNGGAYTEDAVQGMLRYMTVAEYKLAYDPLIAHLRETAQVFRSAASAADARNSNNFNTWLDRWTNSIAGKSNDLDRVVMDMVGGRKLISTLRWLNSRVKSNAVLGNFRSALVQVSNLTNATTYIRNPADWGRGIRSLMEMRFGKDKASMREIYGMSNFMANRYLEVKSLDESDLHVLKKIALRMLSAGDKDAAQLTWWSAYQQYTRNPKAASGMARQYENAVDYADDITRRSVAGRGVGELPTALTSQVIQMAAPFQTEVLNTYNNLVEQVGKKNAWGIVNFEITTFALNSMTQFLFGDRVLGFDFIQVVWDVLKYALRDDKDEDDEEEKDWEDSTLSFAVRRTLGEAASGFPFAAQLAASFIPDETTREKWFGESDPTRYGTGTLALGAIADVGSIVYDLALAGKAVDPFKIADAVSVFALPWGGRQFKRTLEGLHTVASGHGSKVDEEGEERIQFASDRSGWDYAQAALFGKWSLPEAREYLEDPDLLSAEDSEAYKQAVKAGVDGPHFFELRKQMNEFEPIKDDNDKTTETTTVQKARLLFDDKSLTPEQKGILIRPLVDDSVADMAAIAVARGATADEFLRFYCEHSELKPKRKPMYTDNKGRIHEGAAITIPMQTAKLLLSYELPDKNVIALLDSLGDSTDTLNRLVSADWKKKYDVSETLRFYADGVSDTTVQYARDLKKSDGVPTKTYVGYYSQINLVTKDELRKQLMGDDSLTAEQKAAIERTAYGAKTAANYSNEYTLQISSYSDLYDQKCTNLHERYGIEWSALCDYVVQYQELKKKKGSDPIKKECMAIIRSVGFPAEYQTLVYKVMDNRYNEEWKMGKYAETAEQPAS